MFVPFERARVRAVRVCTLPIVGARGPSLECGTLRASDALGTATGEGYFRAVDPVAPLSRRAEKKRRPTQEDDRHLIEEVVGRRRRVPLAPRSAGNVGAALAARGRCHNVSSSTCVRYDLRMPVVDLEHAIAELPAAELTRDERRRGAGQHPRRSAVSGAPSRWRATAGVSRREWHGSSTGVVRPGAESAPVAPRGGAGTVGRGT